MPWGWAYGQHQGLAPWRGDQCVFPQGIAARERAKRESPSADARTQDSTGSLSVSDAHNWWVVRIRSVSDVSGRWKKNAGVTLRLFFRVSCYHVTCHIPLSCIYTFEFHVAMSISLFIDLWVSCCDVTCHIRLNFMLWCHLISYTFELHSVMSRVVGGSI